MEFTAAVPSARSEGKVSKILLCPGTHDAIVLSLKREPRLQLFNSANATLLQDVTIPALALDMHWTQHFASTYLIVLTCRGHYVVLEYINTNGPFFEIQSARSILAHSPVQPNFENGVITCFSRTVVSSVGSGLVRCDITLGNLDTDVSSLRSYEKSIAFPGGLDFTMLTNLLLLSESRLLVFFRSARVIVEFDLMTSSQVKQVNLDYHPSYIRYAPPSKTLMIHDPRVGTHFLLDDSLTAAAWDPILLPESFKELQKTGLMPTYLAFCDQGQSIVIAEQDQIKIYQWSGAERKVYTIKTDCDRLYGVAIQNVKTGIRVVAALMRRLHPSDGHTWNLQTWDGAFHQDHPLGEPEPQHDPIIVTHPSKRPKLTHQYEIQKMACQKTDHLRHCISCWEHELLPTLITDPDPVVDCRFIGFRFDIPSVDGVKGTFSDWPLTEQQFAFTFDELDPPPTEKHRGWMETLVSAPLQQSFEAELRHLQNQDAKRRRFRTELINICDSCFHGLFFQMWFCGFCGKEICSSCYSTLPDAVVHSRPAMGPCALDHAKNWFIPVSFFDIDEVYKVLDKIRAYQTKNAAHDADLSLHCSNPPHISKLAVEDMTEDHFVKLWSGQAPFVVTGVTAADSPASWLSLHGASHPCEISEFDEGTWIFRDGTLEGYFSEWSKTHSTPRHVRDYPKNAGLGDLHPDLQRKFLTYLNKISPTFLTPRGPMNLSSYYPTGSITPDLGPKLYIAERDSQRQGTTPLHLDKCGAVNLMLYGDSGDGNETGARWHIWPRNSIASLSKAVSPSSSPEDCQLGIPIIAEMTYVGDDLIDSDSSGCPQPWTYVQSPGDAVFIPPGCPHQVVNLGNCIKIAADFISPFDIPVLRSLRESFRTMNFQEKKLVHEDLLNVDVNLWYLWNGLKL